MRSLGSSGFFNSYFQRLLRHVEKSPLSRMSFFIIIKDAHRISKLSKGSFGACGSVPE